MESKTVRLSRYDHRTRASIVVEGEFRETPTGYVLSYLEDEETQVYLTRSGDHLKLNRLGLWKTAAVFDQSQNTSLVVTSQEGLLNFVVMTEKLVFHDSALSVVYRLKGQPESFAFDYTWAFD